MNKEISPAVMWGAVALVAVIVLVAGFTYFSRNPGQLSPEEEAKAKATIQQQYQSYFGTQRGGGR
jgi:hypothetical protein